jgi:hypothetical protein
MLQYSKPALKIIQLLPRYSKLIVPYSTHLTGSLVEAAVQCHRVLLHYPAIRGDLVKKVAYLIFILDPCIHCIDMVNRGFLTVLSQLTTYH